MTSILNEEPEVVAATALLAKARHLLTGREIYVCESVINPSETFVFNDDEEDDEDASEGEFVVLGLSCSRVGGAESEEDILARLQTEFSREIGQWHTEQNLIASARAIEAHNRIQDSRQLKLI